MLPSWRRIPLKYAATLNPEVLAEDTPEDFEFDYLDIGGSEESNGTYSHLRFGEAPSRARRVVRAGDTLISTVRTYLRNILYLPDPPSNLIASTGYALLRPRAGIDPGFLSWAIQSEDFIGEVVSRSTGVAYPAIAPTVLGRIPIPFPPLSIQLSARAYLERETARIDSLIARKEHLLGLLQERKTAFVSHVTTRGLDPGVSLHDSNIPTIGQIPAAWDVRRNKTLFREIKDPSPDGSEELLTVSHLTGVTRRSEKDVFMFRAESNEGYKRCRPGDLVINTMWAWMGAAGVAPESGIVSPAYGVYRPNEALHPGYVDLLVRTPEYTAEMGRFSQGVWRSRLRLYPEDFLSLRLPLPPKEEQFLICSRAEAFLQETRDLSQQLKRSISLLRERRQSLITAVVAGELDISAFAHEERGPV
jgi:type I restriction enzyme S subunit